jgi:hypothetical protein
MPFTIDTDAQALQQAAEAAAELEERLAGSRDLVEDFNEEAARQIGFIRAYGDEQVAVEQFVAQQREAMSRESFEKWIGYAAHASDWTRRAFTSATASIGRGIADELVDGTHDWRKSLQLVLKQMIALTAQMIVMRSLMTAMTGGASGWIGLFHAGGAVMHAGGPVRAHSGMELRADEVPLIAQRGEFVMRRRAVEDIGPANLERLNRGGSLGANVSYNFSITVNADQSGDPNTLARRLGPEIVEYLRRESGRGVLIMR